MTPTHTSVTDAEVKRCFPFAEGWNHSPDDLRRYRFALERHAQSRQPSSEAVISALDLARQAIGAAHEQTSDMELRHGFEHALRGLDAVIPPAAIKAAHPQPAAPATPSVDAEMVKDARRYEGRAQVNGEWLPWHPISVSVYENRQRWPREGYEVRAALAAHKGMSHPEPTGGTRCHNDACSGGQLPCPTPGACKVAA